VRENFFLMRSRIQVCLALLAAASSLLLSASEATPATVSLVRGSALFWDGPFVEGSERGRCGGNPCWDYRLELEESGYRLRIGIDHPEVGDVFEVRVTPPGGGTVSSFGPSSGLYSAESLHLRPTPGTWRIRVIAENVSESPFRMRVKLEGRPPSLGTKNGPVLPNLQVLPAHEASFLLPITNGSTDGSPQGVDTQGAEACHPEEHAEDRALRCLRFAFGVRNTGLGPLQLEVGGGATQLERELIQLVERADGTHFARPAGVARWHKTHGHYHHDAAVGLRLYRVVDRRRGKLEPTGERRTKGFAHREELLRDWEHFYPTWDRFGFGLGAGWSDIYEWDRPGNYIDFGLNDDGFYVLRMWADPVNGILESNEKDNVGYTLLKITGDAVKVLEVGRGTDPWDRCKIVMGRGGHPDPPRDERPAGCPPDTT
jgi:hypothetical protein